MRLNRGVIACRAEDLGKSATAYSAFRYGLAILEIFYQLAILFIFAATGLSKSLEFWLLRFTASNFFLFLLYFFTVAFIYCLLDFPISFSQSYLLERRFSLSNQSLRSWFIDQIKAGIVSCVIGLFLLGSFYHILEKSPDLWWLIVSIIWIFFGLILTKFAPLVIIPLFFKYKGLSDEALRQRIIGLAEKMQIKITDVFEIDFSKKTLKANAALLGIGSTRRVILADTLKDKYSNDEIEVILAHEFAHYKLRHLIGLILINSIFILLSFYLISKTSAPFLAMFGLTSLSELAALPVILIYFVLLGIIMQPFQALISRKLEREADLAALKATGLKEPFISMMEKLAAQNLADIHPHPVIKFFFFDHPPIDERIRTAKNFSSAT